MKFNFPETDSVVYLYEEKGRFYLYERSNSGGRSPKVRVSKKYYDDFIKENKKS